MDCPRCRLADSAGQSSGSYLVALLIRRARYCRKRRLSPTAPPLTLPLTTPTNWSLVMGHRDAELPVIPLAGHLRVMH